MSTLISAYVAGLMLSASLIVAIGAQNAFVLGQGLRRDHTLTTAAVCSACDALLIGIGVAGVGMALSLHPALSRLLAALGGVFVIVYGVLAARRAISASDEALQGGGAVRGRRAVVGAALAVSLLNPHAYLDAMLLIGGFAAQFPAAARPAFAAGAVSASVIWFFGLGLGAAALSRSLATPAVWRVVHAATAVMMIGLGLRLLHSI
jgi:L-lysine exporter family protein LysE/ArgO